MSIGERLLELRREKHLSQEEVADRLNVTRQTVSKWETDQSTPDFDKILPLCELYEITADELISGAKAEVKVEEKEYSSNEFYKKKRALGIGIGILLYFIAVCFIMVAIPVTRMNPIVASSIFLVICGIATSSIVYVSIVYHKKKIKKDEKEPKIVKQINSIISMIILVIYLLISFTTFAWHITWILWIVYALIAEIVKLIFLLRGEEDEK